MPNAATPTVLHVQAYDLGAVSTARVTVEPVRFNRSAGTKVTFADGHVEMFLGRMTKRAARAEAVAQRILDTLRNAVAVNEVSS